VGRLKNVSSLVYNYDEIDLLHTIYEKAVFIDTSAFYALLDPKDNWHNQAVECLNELVKIGYPLWMTNLVIIESHDRILQGVGREVALSFLDNIHDGSVNIERVLPEDERDAKDCLRNYKDQDFSYVDAISFSVMKRLGIGTAFTFDHHFIIAGFIRIP
jgi:predicted nucleic acid-binding protein